MLEVSLVCRSGLTGWGESVFKQSQSVAPVHCREEKTQSTAHKMLIAVYKGETDMNWNLVGLPRLLKLIYRNMFAALIALSIE